MRGKNKDHGFPPEIVGTLKAWGRTTLSPNLQVGRVDTNIGASPDKDRFLVVTQEPNLMASLGVPRNTPRGTSLLLGEEEYTALVLHLLESGLVRLIDNGVEPGSVADKRELEEALQARQRQRLRKRAAPSKKRTARKRR